MKVWTQTLPRILLLAALLQTSACGYFLYPERKGQSGGKLDPAVILLDAAGLFIGVLPGVVAFAVDFTNGTIYLPPGGKSAVEKHQRKLSDSLPQSQRDAVAQALSARLGEPVSADNIVFYMPQVGQQLSVEERIEL